MRTRNPTRVAAALIGLAVGGLATASAGELSSKRYRFAANKLLPLALSAGEVEIQSVLFEFPSAVLGIKGSNRAKVKVVNRGSAPARVGLAVALFDPQDRLVGVSAGGTKGIRLKPGAETDYSLPFHFLTDSVEAASSFFISIETR